MENKTFSISLNTFKYLGFLIVGVGITLIFNTVNSFNPSEEILAKNISGGVFGIIIGIIFLFISKKKRSIIFLENKIEYSTSKPIFTANYSDINLIKTFIDPANKSENLMIFVDANNTISFTTSFFPKEKLVEVYQELLLRCEEFITKNEITVDNDLNW
ncbi:MAG: hypothetical protein FWC41_11950 [Firmicutes bacterium]|nr:hypothetical protein [Bacillota bacterium]